MAGGVNVPIGSTWNPKGVKAAQKDMTTLQRQGQQFSKSWGKSFAGIGAALGGTIAVGAVINQFKKMATAAAQDQQSVVRLSKAMRNVGMGGATAEAEAFTKSLMLATGQSDELIRGGLQRLIMATGDLKKAQEGVTLSQDIASATGRSLAEVTKALSRGYSGNAAGLSRLGVGLDKTLLASGDMVKITDELRRKFGGQAAAAANTYAGKLLRINTAADEAQETIGYALLNAIDKVSGAFGGTDGAVGAFTSFGEATANVVTGLGNVAAALAEVTAATKDANVEAVDWGDRLIRIFGVLPGAGPTLLALNAMGDAGERDRKIQEELTAELDRAATMRDIYSGATRRSTVAMDEDTSAADRNRTALEKLKVASDRLASNNRSLIGNRIRLAQMRAEGVDGKSDGKKGISGQDRRTFGLQYAETVASQYDTLFSMGKLKKASNVLSAGREYLSGQVSQSFANRVLPKQNVVDNEVSRRDSARGAEKWRETTKNVYQTFNFGDLQVSSPAEAVEVAKKAARLRALSNPGAQAVLTETYRNPNQGWGLIR